MYTVGFAENAVRNRGAGVYIQYPGAKEDKINLATGLYSTNYKADAKALKTAAVHTEVSILAYPNVVLLMDALSVLRVLQSNRDTDTTICLLLLPRFVEAMQSPCNGFPPTATCLAMRLLTLCKRRHNKEASG